MDVDIERVIKNIEEACQYDQMLLYAIMRKKSGNRILPIKLLNNDLLDYSDEGKDILHV